VDWEAMMQYEEEQGTDGPLNRLMQIMQPEAGWPPLTEGPILNIAGSHQLTKPERALIFQALMDSNTSSSQQTVCTKFKKYYRYCASLKVSPLPVNEARLCLYVKHLEQGKSVQPSIPG
jgi:hypothetical protein